MRNIIKKILILSMVFSCIMMLGSCHHAAEKPRAVEGVLDLSQWDFTSQGPVKLDGEWEFYWNQLLFPEEFANAQSLPTNKDYKYVPKTWKAYEIDGKKNTSYGYGTYRLQIILPTNESLNAIRVSSIATSHEIWINGKYMPSYGKVGIDKNTGTPNVVPNIIYFSSEGETVEVIIQVSNFIHKKGGIWQSLLMGNSNQIFRMHDRSIFFSITLFGSILIMALYHLALYLLRRKDSSALYFSIFCFLIALRILFVGEKFLQQFIPQFPQQIAYKLEYLSFYIGMAVFYMFIHTLFPEEMSMSFYRIVVGIATAYATIVVIIPVGVYSRMLFSFQVFAVIFCIYILYVIAIAFIRRREGAGVILIGAAVFAITVINDIFYYSEMIFTGNLTPFGVFIFIFAQSYILAARFSRAFTTIEQMSEKLLSMDSLKVQFLQAQIKPHFLYNTLNTIMALCRTDPGKAWELLDDLSNYLRGKFSFININRCIPLEKELNFIQSYLAIEKVRFGERLNVEYDISSDTTILVPPLILQPIVENAVRHGIYPKKEGGIVTISVTRQQEAVRIQIRDDGVGMTQHQLKNLLKGENPNQGIGLLNVDTRLKAYYNQGLKIESQLGEGTSVTILIPYRSAVVQV